MRSLLVVTALCVCSMGLSQDLKLQINGPETAMTGDLVVINSTGSTAPLQNWIVPDALIGKSIGGCGDQIGFATRDPGVYTFYLYGGDGERLIHTSHTVVIEGSSPKPPPVIDPDPTDPIPDPKPPVGNFDALKKKSESLSQFLDDAKTASKLAERLNQRAYGDTLATSQLAVELIVTKALSERTRDNQDADWFTGWYIPILKEIQSLASSGQIKTVDQYAVAIQSVALGLKE